MDQVVKKKNLFIIYFILVFFISDLANKRRSIFFFLSMI